ncbi:50S ribosomal protein L21 [Buchnera aphidicola]|uniref:Large ribosomal subunit protein bL21 n=1 Tax=Buchnera aphidicola (Sarucallis kahawaluokalani) TaxID=1241878 RepID=A0A4D6YJI1_9GAMM|nr:50S ribosomal protein L21 [Buchnera aphidicola]QCI26050.1 50S ribosomal protein L21 [Buchnera aphidicola (Sarucallis kahawaluokalani)]
MYAIFEYGGKQYQAQPGKTIRLEKIECAIGKNFNINNILMIVKNKKVTIGTPNISKSSIIGTIVQHGRKKKIKIIKFKRRKHYKKQQGHRQYFTDIKIIDIITKN